jgi:transcriptional regulator with XRE-family HTH domain
MAVSSSTSEKAAGKRSKPTADEPQTPLRTARVKRNLTQREVADLAGMHRNSIVKLENGTTKEVTAENAMALAKVLKTSIADLGLRVRAATEARSIRIRRLTPEQRQIVDELLSLPAEDFGVIRRAVERLRLKRRKKPSRGTRR